MPSSAPPPLDPASLTAGSVQALHSLLEDIGAEGMRAAVAAFESDAAQSLLLLQRARAAGQPADVRKSAHRLKGLLDQFAGPAPAALARAVEQAPDSDLHEQAARLADQVGTIVAAVLAAADLLAKDTASAGRHRPGA